MSPRLRQIVTTIYVTPAPFCHPAGQPGTAFARKSMVPSAGYYKEALTAMALADTASFDYSDGPPLEDPHASKAGMSIVYKQREAIRLGAVGTPYMQISRKLHWGLGAVHEFLTSRIAQAQMKALSEKRDINAADLAYTIQQIAPGALAYMEEVLHSETQEPKLRVSVAKDLLDRAGHAKINRSIIMDVPLAGGVLEDIKSRARDAGILAPEPVETEALPAGEQSELVLDTTNLDTPNQTNIEPSNPLPERTPSDAPAL